MSAWDDRHRRMYQGGRAGPAARRAARFWAKVFAAGLGPARWVTLEVPGRRSGRPLHYPLGIADVGGSRYLVAMLGERSGWVLNARAADNRVTLLHRRPQLCQLIEVPVEERAPILRRYLQIAPGARPHLPVPRSAPLAEFAAAASDYPVFRIEPITNDRR